MRFLHLLFVAALTPLLAAPLWAQSDSDLAKQLANPVADLISVPIELVYDRGLGAEGDGSQQALVIKPVLPFGISPNWNVISRTILPAIRFDDGTDVNSGIGDGLQSFFFSPKTPVKGVTWGVGPIFQIPFPSGEDVARNDWGAGLTAVALKQAGPWTLGALVNHIWDTETGGSEQSTSFLQPFVNYTTSNSWTLALNTESTYDWQAEAWTVPINLKLSRVVALGNQRVSFAATLRHWAQAPEGGPSGYGATLGMTLLFPKG